MLPIIIDGEARDELLYSQFLCMEHEISMRCQWVSKTSLIHYAYHSVILSYPARYNS